MPLTPFYCFWWYWFFFWWFLLHRAVRAPLQVHYRIIWVKRVMNLISESMTPFSHSFVLKVRRLTALQWAVEQKLPLFFFCKWQILVLTENSALSDGQSVERDSSINIPLLNRNCILRLKTSGCQPRIYSGFFLNLHSCRGSHSWPCSPLLSVHMFYFLPRVTRLALFLHIQSGFCSQILRGFPANSE